MMTNSKKRSLAFHGLVWFLIGYYRSSISSYN